MAKTTKKPDPRVDADEEQGEEHEALALPGRDDELLGDDDLEENLRELYRDVEKGYENQWDRSNDILDYWEIFNCKLGGNQYYSGQSKIFLPIVHDAIEARVTRFTNQLFPQSQRYIEVTTEDGQIPHAEMSLVEYYIRKNKFRTRVVPALVRNGDVEGQYAIYVSWVRKARDVAWKVQQPLNTLESDEETEVIREEKLVDEGPHIEVISDTDLLILPPTADSVTDALEQGGSVTLLRRWSKAKAKQLEENGEIDSDRVKDLFNEQAGEKQTRVTEKPKEMADAAGIKIHGTGKYALVYETWTKLKIGSRRQLCRVYYGGPNTILSCKRNPYWNDRCPVITEPVKRVQGVLKGKSLVYPCAQVQYYANDIINEAADSSMYSMMPIVLTDPERNPRIGSMVLSLAAVWEADPQSTQFAKFPDIWKSGFEIVGQCKAQIMQSLAVSPAAITQSAGSKSKPSQADVAREQQVDLLTTADAVTVIEEGILTPAVNFMLELDHQYRKNRVMIRQRGEAGLRAKMDWVPPIQMNKRRVLRWFGVEQVRSQMQVQQQIAGINILKAIPPDQMQGYRLNLVPLAVQLAESLFGPRLAPLIFEDVKAQLTIDAGFENELLIEGHELPVHPMDEDQQHLQAHQQLMQHGDPLGNIQSHIRKHMLQMQLKRAAQMQQAVMQMLGPQALQQGQGQPKPQRPRARPRAGAQPQPPRGGQGPPGMVARDQIGPASGAPPQLRNMGQPQ